MPTTTARLSLTQIASSDPVSAYPVVQNGNMATLDGSALYQSGTFVARPATPTTGTWYFATDLGILYWYSGSWYQVSGASGWVTPTLAAGISTPSNYLPLQCRLEADTVRLRGAVQTANDSLLTTWATLPSNMGVPLYPKGNLPKISPPTSNMPSQFVVLSINHVGTLQGAYGSNSGGAGTILTVDGCSYTIR